MPSANHYQDHKKLLVLFIYSFKVLYHYCTLVNFEYVFVCPFFVFQGGDSNVGAAEAVENVGESGHCFNLGVLLSIVWD